MLRADGAPALLLLLLAAAALLACSSNTRNISQQQQPTDLSLSSTATLNDGRHMPLLGLGVYTLSPQECYGAVINALAAGVRHIDTAELYENEAAVGRALRDSGVDRDDVWLTTKAWNGRTKDVQPDYDGVLAALRNSLALLNVSYVDLYLLHSPFGDESARLAAALRSAPL